MSDLHLNSNQIHDFIVNGFVRIDDAFSRDIAHAVVDVLWQKIPFDRNNVATWTEPVIRLGMFTEEPFMKSVNSPRLHHIFDQLVGAGRWQPCRSVGTFPARFPSVKESTDTGKHVDAGFPGDDPNNFFEWRVNIKSKGRALLMLILYSDVSETDAPTAIYKGSHRQVARLLVNYGDAGLSFMEIADRVRKMPDENIELATGKAGTIYLCHPFLVHAAQAHRGKEPKFMAQPPLLWRGEFWNGITQGEPRAPVAEAIRIALTTDLQ